MKRDRFLFAIPFALALTVFGRVLLNGFTYDDFLVIVNNHYLTGPDLPAACLSNRYFEVSGEGTYRPLVTLLYHVIVRLSGTGPFGLHLAALLLHASTAALVTLLGQRLKLGTWALWPGAAFAVHPLMTEPVCAIGFMEDVLAAFLVMGGLLVALWSAKTPSPPRRLAVGAVTTAVLLLAAALAKESGIILAVLAPAFVLCAGDDKVDRRPALVLTLVLLPAVAVFLFVRFRLLPGDGSSAARLGSGLISSAANTAVIFAKYFGRLCWPPQLSVARHTPLLSGPMDVRFWLAAGLHSALLLGTAGALRSRSLRVPALGVFWFYAALLPTANLVPIFHPEADRYLYLPSIGLFLALAAAARQVAEARPSFLKPLAAMLILPVIAWSAKTTLRVGDWRNNQTLWQHELDMDPHNANAMAELAVEANAVGNYALAEQLARSALELDPENSPARLQLARSLMHNSRQKEALPLYRQLLAGGRLHQHHLAQAWQEMGFIQEHTMNDADEAARAYSVALAVNPFLLDASIRLGMIHATRGGTAEAMAVWKSALRRFPGNEILTHNIRVAEQALKQQDK